MSVGASISHLSSATVVSLLRGSIFAVKLLLCQASHGHVSISERISKTWAMGSNHRAVDNVLEHMFGSLAPGDPSQALAGISWQQTNKPMAQKTHRSDIRISPQAYCSICGSYE